MEPPIKMEAHGATAVSDTQTGSTHTVPSRFPGPVRDTVPAPRVRPAVAQDPFRFGFRYQSTADGGEDLEQVPLTLEDLVYPQEGDHVSQGLPHFSFLHPQADAMRRYLEKRSGFVVTSDVTLVLRSDGKNCAPDVAVIRGDFDPKEIEGAINLRKVGGQLIFALEAVSTSDKQIENKDLETNKERYAEEGVEEYVTIYPKGGRKVSNLVGWRLDPETDPPYVQIPPDTKDRVYAKQLDVFLSIDPETEELVVTHATTGERFLISDEEEAGRVEAERLLAEEKAARLAAEGEKKKAEDEKKKEAAARLVAEDEKKKAEDEKKKEAAARLVAEDEKRKAEDEKKKEAAARLAAEDEKKKEVAARLAAEGEKKQEVAARRKVEADLEQEAKARLQALAEVERLKAQLQQIQGKSDD